MAKFKIQYLQAEQLKFAYIEQGSGPLVLCVHGFPDTAYSWSSLLPELASSGFRAVAFFTRGYYPTDIAKDGDYSALTLAQDIFSIADALGESQFYLVAHDWGALAAYAATILHADRVKKLVTAAIPHPGSLRPNLRILWGARHFLTFQLKKRTIAKVKANNFAFLDEIYRRWSPNWQLPINDVKECFAQPGVTEAALAYYWAFVKDGFGKKGRLLRKVNKRRVKVPSLCFVGESDPIIRVKDFYRAEKFFASNYQVVPVPNSGHFLHLEQPEMFNRETVKFLRG